MPDFCSCPNCGDLTAVEGEGPPPHGKRFRCAKCSRVWWLGKQQLRNRLDTPDERRAFAMQWRRHYGEALCAFCGATKKTHPERSFQLDHKKDLSKGGANELWNTQILCGPCHTLKKNISTREGRRTGSSEGW